MANAAKLMKEKKQRQLEARKAAKLGLIVEAPIKIIDSGTVTEVNVVNMEADLKNTSKAKLIELAEELELDTSGTKADLIEKILE